ncbi:MAG: pyridoxal phosphate-dependent aminotransferase [Clostridiales bacterium]|nr:pyridoxal phosphate-dependent aminotransferase [Clostridiales bacterium]
MKPLSRVASGIKPSSTLRTSAMARSLRAAGEDVIDFGLGELDLPTPPGISAAGIKAIEDGFTKYTAAIGTEELRRAICGKLARDNGLSCEPCQIVVSNGAKHALSNTFAAILDPGDEVIISAPYWLSYPEMVRLCGGVPVIVPPDAAGGFRPNAEAIRRAVTDKTKAVVINSPSNPSGAVASRADLAAIADVAVQNDLYVVSDEIYEKLIYGADAVHVSIASLGGDMAERAVVINGVSKSHAMTGWRIGYSASSPEIARLIAAVQSHQTSAPNSIAQKAAAWALEHGGAAVLAIRDVFARRRGLICTLAADIPRLSFEAPSGAFYLFVDVSGLYGRAAGGGRLESAADVADALLGIAKVAVVPCGDFGCPDHIRITYAASEERIAEGMARIASFARGLGR